MPNLTISNQNFNYPDPGTEAGWGEDATGWAEAVTELLGTLVSNGEILQTTFTVQNNISVAEDIVGMFFNSGIVRSAEIQYAVHRVSDSTPNGLSESGMLLLVLNEDGLVGQKWQFSQMKTGDAGIAFSILDGGQMQYISTDIGTINYSGEMKFTAKVLNV